MRFLSNIWVTNESEILFNRRVKHADPSDFTGDHDVNIFLLTRTGFLIVVLSVSHAASSANYEPGTMTVPASSLLAADILQGEHYKIADDVLISGYMNHYTVDSDFGPFTAVGNRNLKKLLHEFIAIAELKKMTSVSVGTDAAVDAVADTGKSLAALASDPEGSLDNLGAGVSRLFKRTKKAAKDVSAQASEAETEAATGEEESSESDMTSQLASSYLGIGKAQREIASELKVDPYSDNPVLQAELARVGKISGTVGKVTKIMIPIPSVVGTAASVSNLVWNLSPTDLLIQNQETLKALGYSESLIQQFFSNTFYSPTEQTAFVTAVKSLDSAKGREILLQNAVKVETAIEAEFMGRSVLFAQVYHEQVEPVKEIIASSTALVPVVITTSGDGIIFAPLDQLSWTEEVEEVVTELARLMDEHGGSDEHLLWVEGDISELALTKLKSGGWVEKSAAFDKLERIIKD